LALQRIDLPIEVDSDCSNLISKVNRKFQNRSLLAQLMEEIKLLVNGDKQISFLEVDRPQNRASYCLKKQNFAHLSGLI
jgi:hypothetical protein